MFTKLTVLPMILALTIATDANAQTADASDWSGVYAGVQLSATSGTLSSYDSGVFGDNLFTSGTTFGAFAGYNLQRGNFVFGGELAYAAGEVLEPTTSHTVVTDSHIDLKARAGYAVGKALLYGFAGYSTAQMEEGPSASSLMPISGMNYGVGVDYKITENAFIGIEYIARELSGDFNQVDFPGWTTSGGMNSVSIRAGISF